MSGQVLVRLIFAHKIAPSRVGNLDSLILFKILALYKSFTYLPIHGSLGPRESTSQVAAWRSGNVVGRINEVTICRARLVLGWATVFGGQTTSVFRQTTQANLASYPIPSVGREMNTSQSAVMICG